MVFFLFSACTEEEFEITEAPPTVDQAEIIVNEQSSAMNTFVFSNNSDAFIKVWEFSTGQQKKGDEVELYVPFAGEYSVKLTMYNAGGSVSFEDDFTVNQTDPDICNQELITLLTGGCDAENGKTWVVDSTTNAHFGLGPVDASGPIWYAAGALEKSGGGMYDDRYTFYLNNYQFEMETNGEVYINGGQAPEFPGSFESPVGDYTAPYEAPENLNFNLEQGNGNPILTISNGGFLGYYTGVNTYEILELTADVLYVKYLDNVNDFSWYVRFIREGYDSNAGGGGEEPDPVSLPIDFETAEPAFTTFGNSSFEVVDNPDKSGINTSDRVGQTVHGNESWAGLFVDLGEPLDFVANPQVAVKVWAPSTGEFQFKMEDIDDPDNFVEIIETVDVANQWVELVFDLSSAPEGLGKVVIFPGWGTTDGQTFYFDDIRIYEPPVNLPITFESVEPSFGVFGGNSFGVVDNPDQSGINTSSRVGETVHGNESWGGLFVELDQNLDLASNPTISIKVWSPIVTDMIMKLENLDNADLNTEITKTIDTANEWVELTFDFTGQPNDFGRIVIFPGFGTTDANTFYFDDIQFGQ